MACFFHDAGESTVMKRIAAFQANGSDVTGFTFRRLRNKRTRVPFWTNIDLGVTEDRNYLARLPRLALGLFTVLRHWRRLRQARVLYARNIDMLIIAVLARALTGSRGTLVYEVLDIQRIFLGEERLNRCVRWIERALLKATDLLVVSSPDFMSRYFVPVQGYDGAWHLLENKVSATKALPDPTASQTQKPPAPPWVIGWFGVLRCRKSLGILERIAEALGDKVAIHLRGITSEEDITLAEIEQRCARHANMSFLGPYLNPDDLADIYGPVHLAWSIDYLDAGSNSDWLLPNRLYEAGLFGVPALTRQGTATARKAEQDGLGWALAEPLDQTVPLLLATLGSDRYDEMRREISSKDRSFFVDIADTRDLLLRIDALGAKAQAAVGRA
jgi:succinoglycan biosynthesis protein ExoL